jgi:hypothetical protein
MGKRKKKKKGQGISEKKNAWAFYFLKWVACCTQKIPL